MARVIMLNDGAWAITTNPELSNTDLIRLGKAECNRRGWRHQDQERDPQRGDFQGLVYVHVDEVLDLDCALEAGDLSL